VSKRLRVGQVVYGFCGGCFGRDSYGPRRVEAMGADWVICRTDSGYVEFYAGSPEDLLEYTDAVCKECDYQGKAVGGGLLNAEGAVCPRCGFCELLRTEP
jgi:hypothetical protein